MQRQERDFILTLPSNTSESNTPSNYTVQLQSYVELEGDWEVAATEIQFSRTWYNLDHDYVIGAFVALRTARNPSAQEYVNEEDVELNAWRTSPWGKSSQEYFKYFKVVIPRGHYPTYHALASEICRAIKTAVIKHSPFADFEVTYVYNEDLRAARLEPRHLFLLKLSALHEDLLEMIGIRKVSQQNLRSTVPAVPQSLQRRFRFFGNLPLATTYNPVKDTPAVRDDSSVISRSTKPSGLPRKPAVFAYCNIIDHQFVGDVKAQLLGVIPVRYAGTARIHCTFTPPYYSRVVAKSFNSVHVWLADHLGDEIRFTNTSDFAVLRLHLRPCLNAS